MRIASISYATSQGLAHLMRDFYRNGIVTDPIVIKHRAGGSPNLKAWYPEWTPYATSVRELPRIVGGMSHYLDAILFFETPFAWDLIPQCRENGIKTILSPMHEWCPTTWPAKPDALICPSLLDQDYFKDEFDICPFIPIPVETKYWKQRTRANRFLHNAGNIGHGEHKGTRELLKAIPLVKNPNFRITIRAQNMSALQRMMVDVPEAKTDPRLSIQPGEIPYGNLWDGYDVLVQPEKWNGLSLPLQEAYAAGMAVMTSDRYPHNTWLPKAPLIPVSEYRKNRVASGYREVDEAIVKPEDIAAKIDEWIGRDISWQSGRALAWAEDNSWESLKPQYIETIKEIVG